MESCWLRRGRGPLRLSTGLATSVFLWVEFRSVGGNRRRHTWDGGRGGGWVGLHAADGSNVHELEFECRRAAS